MLFGHKLIFLYFIIFLVFIHKSDVFLRLGFGGGYISVIWVGLVLVPLLQRVTFGKRPKSNQKVCAPSLGASPRLGMPSLRLESVGRRDGPSLAQRG